jgi:hypothetical protein
MNETKYVPGSYSQQEKPQRFTMSQFLDACQRDLSQEPAQLASIEQPILLEKTKKVRKDNEKVIELIARTGISLDQLLHWNKQQISDFCQQIEINQADDPIREPKSIF